METVLKTSNAIGFVDAVALAENLGKIRALKFDGVEMNAEGLRTGRYPLKKDLYFVFKDEPSTAAKHFIDFCLSDAGQRIILAAGAIPALQGE